MKTHHFLVVALVCCFEYAAEGSQACAEAVRSELVKVEIATRESRLDVRQCGNTIVVEELAKGAGFADLRVSFPAGGLVDKAEVFVTTSGNLLAIMFTHAEPHEPLDYVSIHVFETRAWRQLAALRSVDRADVEIGRDRFGVLVWRDLLDIWSFGSAYFPRRFVVGNSGETKAKLEPRDLAEYSRRLKDVHDRSAKRCSELGEDDIACEWRDTLATLISVSRPPP